MAITDQINMMGENPYAGTERRAFGPRFPDIDWGLHAPLSRAPTEIAREKSAHVLFEREFVQLAHNPLPPPGGPYYETPAEKIRK